MAISNANDAFVQELGAIYHAEQRLVEAQQEMLEHATDGDLRASIEQHLGQTQGHVANVEGVFAHLGHDPDGSCQTIETLIAEGQTNITEAENPAATDLAIGAAIVKAEHYEIATYTLLVSGARQAGMDEDAVVAPLNTNLSEDQEALSIAEGSAPQLVHSALG